MDVPPPGATAAEEEDGSDWLRIYQVWRGSNVFFLQGRFIFGPDVWSLFLTIFLIVAPVSVFCVFVARKLMDDYNHGGISIMIVAITFTLYDIVLLLLTSGRDPGIIPRNRHPPESESYDAYSELAGEQTPQLRLPRMKDVVVNGITVKIKYCDTCMLYRPPRCSHCSICNNCVEHFDHHCPWVGQCIGLRNYRFYYMFVFSTTLLCFYVFAFCWVHIMIIKDAEKTTVGKAIRKAPASIALIIYTFVSVWFVGGLSVFHFYLISTNQTTYENFRYRYDRRDNPYNKGVVQNFMEVFFTRIPPSKNNFLARARRDQWPSSQSNSASYIGPNMSNSEANSASYIGRNTGKSIGNFETDRKPIIWGAGAGDSSDLEAGSDYMPMRKDNSFASDALSGSASDLEAGPNSMRGRIDRRLISNTLPDLAWFMPSGILEERKSGHFSRSFSTGTGVGESHRHGGNFTRSFSTGIGVGESNRHDNNSGRSFGTGFGARKSNWHGSGSGSTTSGHCEG